MTHTDSTFVLPFNGMDISCGKTSPQGRVRAAVLLVHGLGGQSGSDTHLALAPKLAEQGIASVRFDFIGHGQSGGDTLDLTIGLGAELVDTVYNAMCAEFPAVPTGILGASFGGTTILQSGAMAQAAAVVMRSPVADYCAVRQRQLGADKMKQWQQDGQIGGLISRGRQTPWRFYEEARGLDFFAKAAGQKTPLLVVQGTADTTAPMADTARLVDAWAGEAELVQIEGGDHSLSAPRHTELFIALSVHWFVSHLTISD